MQDELFVISFKTEGFEQLSDKSGKDGDDGGDGGDGDTDLDEDDLLSDEEKEKARVVLPVLKTTSLLILLTKGRK